MAHSSLSSLSCVRAVPQCLSAHSSLSSLSCVRAWPPLLAHSSLSSLRRNQFLDGPVGGEGVPVCRRLIILCGRADGVRQGTGHSLPLWPLYTLVVDLQLLPECSGSREAVPQCPGNLPLQMYHPSPIKLGKSQLRRRKNPYPEVEHAVGLPVRYEYCRPCLACEGREDTIILVLGLGLG